MNRALLLFVSCWGLASIAGAAEFCALRVEVQQPNGKPARLIPVVLRGPAGDVVFDERIDQSPFEICDFGYGMHSLQVGYSFCYPTTIGNLRMRLGDPIRLTIRLNECPPDVIHGRCDMNLKVKNKISGKGIGGVRVVGRQPVPIAGTTDSYGRVQLFFQVSGELEIDFSADGFEPLRHLIPCKGLEEREIFLKPLPQ